MPTWLPLLTRLKMTQQGHLVPCCARVQKAKPSKQIKRTSSAKQHLLHQLTAAININNTINSSSTNSSTRAANIGRLTSPKAACAREMGGQILSLLTPSHNCGSSTMATCVARKPSLWPRTHGQGCGNPSSNPSSNHSNHSNNNNTTTTTNNNNNTTTNNNNNNTNINNSTAKGWGGERAASCRQRRMSPRTWTQRLCGRSQSLSRRPTATPSLHSTASWHTGTEHSRAWSTRHQTPSRRAGSTTLEGGSSCCVRDT